MNRNSYTPKQSESRRSRLSFLRLGLSIIFATTFVIVYFGGNWVKESVETYPGKIYYDAPEDTVPVRAQDPFSSAMEDGFIDDAASLGVLSYLRTHANIPDYVILNLYPSKRENTD